MQEQATSLAQLVSVFRLRESEEAALHGVPGTPAVPLARTVPAGRRLSVALR